MATIFTEDDFIDGPASGGTGIILKEEDFATEAPVAMPMPMPETSPTWSATDVSGGRQFSDRPKKTMAEEARQVLDSFVRGGGQMIGEGAKGLAISDTQMANQGRTEESFLQMQNRMNRAPQTQQEQAEFWGSPPSPHARQLPTAEKHPLYKAGQRFNEWLERELPNDPDLADSFFRTRLPEGLGSMAAFLGGSTLSTVVTKNPGPAAAMIGALIEKGAMYSEAKAKGASERDALMASDLGVGIGATEAIPIADLFRRIDKATSGQFTKTFTDVLKTGAYNSVEEAFQEAALNRLPENMVARALYEKDRALFDGVVESGATGGIGGMLGGSGLSYLQYRSQFQQDPSRTNAKKAGYDTSKGGEASTESQRIELAKQAATEQPQTPIQETQGENVQQVQQQEAVKTEAPAQAIKATEVLAKTEAPTPRIEPTETNIVKRQRSEQDVIDRAVKSFLELNDPATLRNMPQSSVEAKVRLWAQDVMTRGGSVEGPTVDTGVRIENAIVQDVVRRVNPRGVDVRRGPLKVGDIVRQHNGDRFVPIEKILDASEAKMSGYVYGIRDPYDNNKLKFYRRDTLVPQEKPAQAEQAQEVLSQNKPDWLSDTINSYFERANRAGVVDLIESMSADRKTALQISKAIKDKFPNADQLELKGIVQSVRSKLGIPSMDDTLAFRKWIDGRSESASPEPTAPGPQPAQTPDAVSSLLSAGEPLESMGAAPSESFEVGPRGEIRPKMRSAADLVGDAPELEPSSPHASPDSSIESAYQRMRQGVGKKSLADKMRSFWKGFVRATAHGSLPHLKRSEEFGEARSALQAYRRAPAQAVTDTEELLARTVKPLASQDYDLFNRAVFFSDLAQTEGDLPSGWTKDQVQAENARLQDALKNNPKAQAAVDYRKQYQQSAIQTYVDAYKGIGVDMTEKFQRPDYFHHMVLDFARADEVSQKVGVGQRVQTKLGRGWLKRREGSTRDINANYLEVEWKVLTQMLSDARQAQALSRVKDQYDIRPDLEAQAAQAREEGNKDAVWQDYIPETHSEYVVRPGRANFMTDTIAASLADEIMEAGGEEIGVTADDLRKILAVGRKYPTVVVPNEIAAQMEEIQDSPRENMAAKIDRFVIRAPVRGWKAWQTIGPLRVLSYNIRNSSEVDKAISLNPSTAKEIPTAAADLYRLFYDTENASSEVMEWRNRGGAQTLFLVNDLSEVNHLKRFLRLTKEPTSGLRKAAELPGKTWRAYWNTAGKATNFRESILRYAAYRDYLRQIRENGGQPKNYGASVPAEIDGIVDERDKAMRLASDLLGDYEDISPLGDFVRRHLYPFWAFQEVNARAYWNGVKNLANSEATATAAGTKIARLLGGQALLKSPYLIYKLGRIGVLLYGFNALVNSVNRWMFPEDDDEIPAANRRQPHLTLGRKENGDVRYFNRLGTASDFLEWIGADALNYDLMDILNGRRTLKEVVQDMAVSPVNKLIQGVGPAKTIAENLIGWKLYPDFRKPIKIRDRWEHLADSFGLGNDYRKLKGKPQPQRTMADKVLDRVTTSVQPGSSAYYEILDAKYRFMRQIGKGTGVSDGARTEALRDFKMAIRFNDKEAADRAIALYASMGGTVEGIELSFQAMSPLSGLNEDEQMQFYASLSEEEKKTFEKAVEFYSTVLVGEPSTQGSSR